MKNILIKLLGFIFLVAIFYPSVNASDKPYLPELIDSFKNPEKYHDFSIYPDRFEIKYFDKNDKNRVAVFKQDSELFSLIRKVYPLKKIQQIPDFSVSEFEILYQDKLIVGFPKDVPYPDKEFEKLCIDTPENLCSYRDYEYQMMPLSIIGNYLSYHTSVEYIWKERVFSIKDFYTLDYKKNKPVSLLDLFQEESLVTQLKATFIKYFDENQDIDFEKKSKSLILNAKNFSQLSQALEKMSHSCSFLWHKDNAKKFSLKLKKDNSGFIYFNLFISNFVTNACRDKVIVIESKALPLSHLKKNYDDSNSSNTLFFTENRKFLMENKNDSLFFMGNGNQPLQEILEYRENPWKGVYYKLSSGGNLGQSLDIKSLKLAPETMVFSVKLPPSNYNLSDAAFFPVKNFAKFNIADIYRVETNAENDMGYESILSIFEHNKAGKIINKFKPNKFIERIQHYNFVFFFKNTNITINDDVLVSFPLKNKKLPKIRKLSLEKVKKYLPIIPVVFDKSEGFLYTDSGFIAAFDLNGDEKPDMAIVQEQTKMIGSYLIVKDKNEWFIIDFPYFGC